MTLLGCLFLRFITYLNYLSSFIDISCLRSTETGCNARGSYELVNFQPLYVIRTNKTHDFNLIIVSSTCFEHPSVHPQEEDMYMRFYGVSLTYSCKKSGRWQDVFVSNTSCHRPDCLYGCMKEIKENCMYKSSSWRWTLGCSKHV